MKIAKEKEKSLQEKLVKDAEKVKIDGFGLLKGIGSFTKEDELKGQLDEDTVY